MKKGIDISYCQKGLDLTAAKQAGVEYVIVRAGIAKKRDEVFEAHMQGAIKAGLPYGFYWYSSALSAEDAEMEAKACLSTIKPYKPVYPVYYDMESDEQIKKLDNEIRTKIIIAFCETIKNEGYTAGVYINPSWLETYVNKSEILGKYDIWLAHWTNSPSKPSHYSYGQKMWQWGKDKICGMAVDGDICFFDYK